MTEEELSVSAEATNRAMDEDQTSSQATRDSMNVDHVQETADDSVPNTLQTNETPKRPFWGYGNIPNVAVIDFAHMAATNGIADNIMPHEAEVMEGVERVNTAPDVQTMEASINTPNEAEDADTPQADEDVMMTESLGVGVVVVEDEDAEDAEDATPENPEEDESDPDSDTEEPTPTVPNTDHFIYANRGDAMQESPDCRTCLTPPSATEAIYLECGHIWCRTCLNVYFTSIFTDRSRFPPRCCQDTGIGLENVQTHLDDAVLMHVTDKWEEWSTANPTFCATPGCHLFLSAHTIEGSVGTCLACKQKTCTTCKMLVSVHDPETPDVHPTPIETKDDKDNAELADKKGWKKCPNPKCNKFVERIDGCDSMTCKCGQQFCFRCAKGFEPPFPCTCGGQNQWVHGVQQWANGGADAVAQDTDGDGDDEDEDEEEELLDRDDDEEEDGDAGAGAGAGAGDDANEDDANEEDDDDDEESDGLSDDPDLNFDDRRVIRQRRYWAERGVDFIPDPTGTTKDLYPSSDEEWDYEGLAS